MQEKESIFQGDAHYSYAFAGGYNNVYFFETAYKIVYEVRFKPSPYIFGEDSVYAPYLYEFSLIMSYKPEGYIKIASDDFIPATVVAILLEFYKNNNNNICIYICDSSDFKQHVRKRKFDLWFLEFNKGEFIKIDEKFIDKDGSEYPVALLMKISNPYRAQLFEALTSLVRTVNDDKQNSRNSNL